MPPGILQPNRPMLHRFTGPVGNSLKQEGNDFATNRAINWMTKIQEIREISGDPSRTIIWSEISALRWLTRLTVGIGPKRAFPALAHQQSSSVTMGCGLWAGTRAGPFETRTFAEAVASGEGVMPPGGRHERDHLRNATQDRQSEVFRNSWLELRRFKATRKRLIEMGETSIVRWDTPKTPMQCRPIDLAQWLLFGVWRTIDHEPARQIRSGQAVRP